MLVVVQGTGGTCGVPVEPMRIVPVVVQKEGVVVMVR